MAGNDLVPDGVPPEEALVRYTEAAPAAEYAELKAEGFDGKPRRRGGGWGGPPTDADRKLHRARALRQQLEAALIDRLQTGELVASGYDARAPVDAPSARIPAHRWRSLSLDFDNAAATDGGLRVSGLLIAPAEVTPVRRATAAAERECQEWLVRLMRAGPKQRAKARYRAEAQERFGVTARAFERAWGQAVAETGRQDWSKPGRKS